MVSKNLDIMVPWALGSDTGESIREPAAFCGVVGLKPTYELVSRYGLVAFASSLDQIGPITKDVRDSAMLLNIITGHDDSLDIAEYALATYYIIACAETSSNLGRFDGIRYGYRAKDFTNLKELYRKSRTEAFGEEVKRRIILGTYVLSSGYYDAYYKKAQKVRTFVKKQFLADICTVSINIASVPEISIPCGVDKNGMPVGMQLIGDRFSEAKLLNAAYTFEQKIQFKQNHKPEFKK